MLSTSLTIRPFMLVQKQIEIYFHFIRERVDRGLLTVQFIDSVDQLAGLFTY